MLSAKQQDAFIEIVNIGVGEAASSLNEITGSHIALKVPDIEVFRSDELTRLTETMNMTEAASVIQSFQGDFHGAATLVFPPDSASKLVMTLTGEDEASPGLDALRRSTLMEIGNIVINAIVGTMSNLFHCTLNYRLPEYYQDQTSRLFQRIGAQEESGVILLAQTEVFIEEMQVSGYVLIVFAMRSINPLLAMIDEFSKA